MQAKGKTVMYLPAEMMEIGEVSVAAKDKARKKKDGDGGLGEAHGKKTLCVLPGSILPNVDPYTKLV